MAKLPTLPADFFGAGSMRNYAIQARLQELGYNPGPIDGLWGAKSQAAFQRWVNRPVPVIDNVESRTLLSVDECTKVFGLPGIELGASLVRITLPFAMRLEWDMGKTIQSISVHPQIADAMSAAFAAVAEKYTLAEISELGLNRYSGTYAHRKVRGGTSWSKHAFGVAIDIYAERNGLHTPWAESAFSGPRYAAFVAAFENAGFANLGKVMGRDAMHFEISREYMLAQGADLN